MTDDAPLLSRYVRERSESAFAEIVHRHLDGVYSTALRRVGGDAHLAQDVSQKVFIALAKKAEALAGHPFLTGWLYAAAKAEAANAVRTEQRRKNREQEAQAMGEQNASDAVPLDWGRLAPVLDLAIDQLDEPDRRAVLLRFIESKRYGEIGAALQITEDAARMRTQRALDQLRTFLQGRGLVSTVAALEMLLTDQAVAAAPAGVVTAVTQAALAGGAPIVGAAGVGLAIAGALVSPAFLAAVVMVAGGTAAGYEWKQASRESALLAQSQSAYQSIVAKVRVDARNSAAAAAARREAASRPNSQAPAGASGSASPEEAAVARGKAFMERHPDVKAAFTAWMDASTHAEYAKLYRDVGLNPAQISQFESLMRFGRGMGCTIPGGEIQLTPDGGQSPTDAMTAVYQLLGQAAFAQLQAYQNSMPARQTVATLAAALAPTDAPLSPSQIEPLADILVKNKRDNQFDWDQVQRDAQALLTAPQLEMLANVRTASETMNSLQ